MRRFLLLGSVLALAGCAGPPPPAAPAPGPAVTARAISRGQAADVAPREKVSDEVKARGPDLGRPRGKPKLVLDTGGHTDPVFLLAFSGDGTQLFSASSDRSVRVWDLASGQTPRGPAWPRGPTAASSASGT